MASHTVIPPILLIAAERDEVRASLAQMVRLYGVKTVHAVPESLARVTAARVVPDVIMVVAEHAIDKATALIRDLRTDLVTRHTPIVARVTEPSQGATDSLRTAGADRVLLATNEPSTLINTIIRLTDVPEPCRALRELRRGLAQVRQRSLDQRTDISAARVRIAQLSAALQQFPISMLGAESNGTCIAANTTASAVTGLRRDEILGKPLWDVVLPGAGRDLHSSWSTVLVIGAVNGPCALRRRDGGSIAADMYAAAYVLPDLHVAAIQTTQSEV